jgi:hypothetical protein
LCSVARWTPAAERSAGFAAWPARCAERSGFPLAHSPSFDAHRADVVRVAALLVSSLRVPPMKATRSAPIAAPALVTLSAGAQAR